MKNTTITKTLSVSLALLLCHALNAQPLQPPVADKIGFSISTESTGSGDTRLKGGALSYEHVQVNNASWVLSQSISLDEASSLTLGITYNKTAINEGNYHHFERDYSADRVPLPNDLQSLGASFGYSTKINNDWSFSSSIGASSNVAKHDLLSKGWGVNGSVVGIYCWSPATTVAVGVAYDSLSKDWRCLPVFGVEWRLDEKWSVAIGFPKTAISYKISDRLTLALAASGSGGTYFIKDDPRPGVAPRSLAQSKLEYLEVRLGLEAAWKINETFSLSGGIGSVLYREFKYIDRDYTLKARDVAPFLSLGLSARL